MTVPKGHSAAGSVLQVTVKLPGSHSNDAASSSSGALRQPVPVEAAVEAERELRLVLGALMSQGASAEVWWWLAEALHHCGDKRSV